MPESPRHSVSVAGVVVNDQGQVLVIQRRDNREWEPPGGILELDEALEEGLKREILEEAGVEANVGPLTGVYKNMQLGVIALVFRCKPAGGQLRTSDETEQVKWMSLDQIEAALSPDFTSRVRDALGQTDGAKYRSHSGDGHP
ncbi:MAG: NUDIX hydrolase [Acidobacteria bacterium]|nr:NUDIX hydrolase [Acidobacteriota bacterium]